MLVRLDTTSDLPIYLQIVESLRGQIERGLPGVGKKLPPARKLAGSLDVNMHTVLKAYSILESEGLVEIRRGRGGVTVLDSGELKPTIQRLVATARRTGVSRPRLVHMIEEAWL